MRWLNKRKPVTVQKVLAFGVIAKGRTARIAAGGFEFSEGFTHSMKIPPSMRRRYWGKHKILCAAIFMHWRDLDGKEHKRVFAVPVPKRHHDVFMLMREQGVKIEEIETLTQVQGFNSSTGFVNRRVGLSIARNAGQIIKKHPSYDELYSEDMW
ncbi:hypothetical protein [Acetobacter orientalis]|nr:hypothetical protein [Acetobacter orientalis]